MFDPEAKDRSKCLPFSPILKVFVDFFLI